MTDLGYRSINLDRVLAALHLPIVIGGNSETVADFQNGESHNDPHLTSCGCRCRLPPPLSSTPWDNVAAREESESSDLTLPQSTPLSSTPSMPAPSIVMDDL
ncbi:unnamed protein product [Linum trigynum]|uniref:Uncharacterized protein n=1 Tax=Linum trigynum TaxID=586398 RepID=A0AAV2CIG0_9ROSI